MVYIAINVVFNAFLLAAMLLAGSSITHIQPLVSWCIAYVIVGGLTVIGYTKLATGIVGFFISGRDMIGRERARLEPLLQNVIDKTNQIYGTAYKVSDFKIKVTDNKIVNALAIGYKTVTVDKGVFDAFNDEQLRAILAHEMGHLYYRDSVHNIALIFSSISTRIIMTLYGISLAISSAFSKDVKNDVDGAFAVASWVPVLFFLPVVILNWIGSKVFTLLNMYMSKGKEYRADAFAASLGYKTDLISALEIIDQITVYDNSFISKLLATHPSAMQRIGALEDEEVARKKIGNLFVGAMPAFAEHKANPSKNLEAIRLGAILSLFGIVWFVWGYTDKIRKSSLNANKTAYSAISNEQSRMASTHYRKHAKADKNHQEKV